jgi:hypothetical protein
MMVAGGVWDFFPRAKRAGFFCPPQAKKIGNFGFL